MIIEGKCAGRRLRVTIGDDTVTVEPLNGDQAGSIFTYMFSELKKRPDLIIDRSTRLYCVGLLGAILFGFLVLMTAVNWGKGITVQTFCVSLVLTAISILIMRIAPRRRVYLWNTTGGIQAFGLDENAKNKEELHLFLNALEASVDSKK